MAQKSLAGAVGLGNFNIGLGTIGNMIALFGLGLLIIILIGVFIFMQYQKKLYKYRIPLFTRVGNVPTRIAVYMAREVIMGKAGDRLWYIRKIKKYIPPPTIQSAANEFWHYQREDGEWVNFKMDDLDSVSKKAGVKYIDQDMRMMRLGIARNLEQRFNKQSFMEKWGNTIGSVIFFMVVSIAMVVFFHQLTGVVEKLNSAKSSVDQLLKTAVATEKKGTTAELIPAIIFPFFNAPNRCFAGA